VFPVATDPVSFGYGPPRSTQEVLVRDLTMPTGSHVDIAEREARDNRKVARLGFIVLLLLIVMATAVWIGIAAWFVGHTIHAW
jgi:hypothetical protein